MEDDLSQPIREWQKKVFKKGYLSHGPQLTNTLTLAYDDAPDRHKHHGVRKIEALYAMGRIVAALSRWSRLREWRETGPDIEAMPKYARFTHTPAKLQGGCPIPGRPGQYGRVNMWIPFDATHLNGADNKLSNTPPGVAIDSTAVHLKSHRRTS